jgi:uncharacterized membrane protein/predicted DsbA family dithiol-disulfide isomerase
MFHEWTNRLVFLLACVGAFIALVIGIAHSYQVSLPCGMAQAGCDEVQRDPWSRFLGIPIAFYGAILYIAVAGMAFGRAVAGLERTPRLASAIWFLLGVGSIISTLLLAHAEFQIRARCIWCLASGITMLTAFIIHSAGMLKPGEGSRRYWPWFAYPAIFLSAVLAAVALGSYQVRVGQRVMLGTVSAKQEAPYFREEDLIVGNPKAKVTIVEFIDVFCAQCRKLHETLKPRFQTDLKGKVKVVYRNFPIDTLHPKATTLAMFLEWATEQGKGEAFLEEALKLPLNPSENQIYSAVEAAGLSREDAKALYTTPSLREVYLYRVYQDMADLSKLGEQVTPHWFVIYPDGSADWAKGDGILTLINAPKFRRAIQEQ